MLPPVDGTLLATMGTQGANVMPAQEIPCELFLFGIGLAPRRVQVTGPEVHVTMRPRQTAKVRVTGVPELPPGFTLQAQARPLTLPTKIADHYQYDWGAGNLTHFAPLDTKAAEVVDGEVELVLLDGAHDLEFWLFSRDGRQRLTRSSLSRIPGSGSYVVELSADEIEDLVRR